MKIFLSPAKRLNEEEFDIPTELTRPQFLNEAEKVMASLSKKSPRKLENLQGISSDLAALNYERNHSWEPKVEGDDVYPAAWMFDGEVYRGLRESNLNKKQISYLQDHLIILSGLYGALKITDAVMPYRLEMGTDLKVGKNKNLYDFWTKKLTQHINDQIEEDEIMLDLSSKEYISVLDRDKIKGKWVDVKFKDYREGKLKQITVYFKKARGEMALYCAQTQAKTIDDLKNFEGMGYAYDDNLSTDNLLIFTR